MWWEKEGGGQCIAFFSRLNVVLRALSNEQSAFACVYSALSVPLARNSAGPVAHFANSHTHSLCVYKHEEEDLASQSRRRIRPRRNGDSGLFHAPVRCCKRSNRGPPIDAYGKAWTQQPGASRPESEAVQLQVLSPIKDSGSNESGREKYNITLSCCLIAFFFMNLCIHQFWNSICSHIPTLVLR